MSQTLYTNIKSLYQTYSETKKALRNDDMGHCPHINQAYLLTEGDKIVDFGEMVNMPETYKAIEDQKDLTGKLVLPTYVDSHTHLVFAAPRESEFEDRIHGLTYEEIALRGGGILNSAKKLAEKSEDELFVDAKQRLLNLVKMGTGAIEIKSGYGLSYEAELKILRVAKRLKQENIIPIKSTFLGAHAIPVDYKGNREGYIKMLLEDVLPVIKEEGLAEYIDVFCEKNYFTVEETEQILEAGIKAGLKPKIHVNQFNAFGGVQAGVKYNAVSVDHLEEMNEADFETLRTSETIATALPSCSFFLSIPYAPVKDMINQGLAISLASDFNPGSTPSGNLSFVYSLACIKQKLTPQQALNALTVNAAFALEVEDTHGSITKGKQASFMITKPISSLAYIPYSFGENQIEQVVINGKAV